MVIQQGVRVISDYHMRIQNCKNSHIYYGPLFYNKLPRNMKLLKDEQFIKSVRELLLKCCAFHNVKEFSNFHLNM